MKKLITLCVVVLFVTNAYAASTLVYDNGDPQSAIQQAMDDILGAGNWDLRNAATPLADADLTSGTYDLVVIGWNLSGDTSGLTADLAAGITGNILLTGHDADYHTEYGWDSGPSDPGDAVEAAATAFLTQAMSFATAQGGVGLVALGDAALGDPATSFSYLPSAWGISATGGLQEETIDSFTTDGLSSGVYSGLTPGDMSDWGQSYHARFDSWGAGFVSFELARDNAITIGRVILAPGALLLGSMGMGIVGWLRRRRML